MMVPNPVLVPYNEFRRRSAEVRARQEAGEEIDVNMLADLLGLSPEFTAAACGLAVHLRDGKTVVLSPELNAHSAGEAKA
ncbi:hypothetical protein [Mongoliimonas terrestris]|uniref:hypothetical protein n=1 Tax=Mongoliimonas terrestris TaxID=1709001 RepID=UPI0009497641|nr:hypothetical protein [Mongoliimonas terrestris]